MIRYLLFSLLFLGCRPHPDQPATSDIQNVKPATSIGEFQFLDPAVGQMRAASVNKENLVVITEVPEMMEVELYSSVLYHPLHGLSEIKTYCENIPLPAPLSLRDWGGLFWIGRFDWSEQTKKAALSAAIEHKYSLVTDVMPITQGPMTSKLVSGPLSKSADVILEEKVEIGLGLGLQQALPVATVCDFVRKDSYFVVSLTYNGKTQTSKVFPSRFVLYRP